MKEGEAPLLRCDVAPKSALVERILARDLLHSTAGNEASQAGRVTRIGQRR